MYQRPIKVYCKNCKDWINETKTKFVNIEEDFQGRDMLTFICPVCKLESKSHRVS